MQLQKHIHTILNRFISGLYTCSDVDALSHSFRLREERVELEKNFSRVWYESEHHVETAEHQQEKYKSEARILLRKIQKKEARFIMLPYLKYAAVIVLLSTLTWGLFQLSENMKKDSLVYTELWVRNGENKRVALSDGTIIWLNAGSVLKYPNSFYGDTRLIEIDGEAFFEVAHNESKPFIVRTKNADVKVLGTSFNVKAYGTDEQLCVSVKSGKVQVDMPEAMMRLLPNEQLLLDKASGELLKRNENVRKTTNWMLGGLYFNKTPIRSVVRELKRMYNREIVFALGAEYTDLIYGEHDNKSLESVLNSIQYATDIKYRQDGQRIVLYKE